MSNYILASGSPRRKILLKKIIQNFKIIIPDINESNIIDETPIKTVLKISLLKGKQIADKIQNDIKDYTIISADTIVVLDNKIFGKPSDFSEAKLFLKQLIGKTHQVITAFSIITPKYFVSDYDISKVKIKNLNNNELTDYIQNSNCLDKAGAYGIQDMKSFNNKNSHNFDIVESYFGDFDNIVGLPLKKLTKHLKI